MNISQKTLSNPVLVIVVFALLGITGLFMFRRIEVSLMPNITEPYLMIFASYPNAGPESVEKAVTKVIEDGLVSINKLKKMTSVSSDGMCTIGLEFYYGTNLDAATNEVRDAIDLVRDELPKTVKTPSIMKMNMNSIPIMEISIKGNRSSDELKRIAKNQVKGILLQGDGVAQVYINGGRNKIVCVELSQNRLAAFDLTVTEVASRLSLENLDLGGGKITQDKKDFVIRTAGEYKSIEEINETVIEEKNGYNVRLCDVGRAYFGFEKMTQNVFIDGENGIYLSVTKQSGTNSVKVADSLYVKLEELKELLPADVTLSIISDDSVSIRETLHTLFESAWQGIVLAVIVLFVFLKNIKSTFIISISIPFSIIITLLLMYCAGITLNIMTLTGLILGVGMVVDASIVMIDNIYSYRERGTKANVAAILGTQEMISSVLSGNLTTIVVFVPFLLYMKDLGFMGQMAKDMIFTVVMAIVASLFVAVFLVPVLAGHFLPLSNRKENPVRNPFLVKLYAALDALLNKATDFYKSVLHAAVLRPKSTAAVCTGVLLLSFALVPFLHFKLMPESDGDMATINITLPAGSSIENSTDVIRRLEAVVIREVKGYKTIITTVGISDGGDGEAASNKGSIEIILPELKKQIDTTSDIKKKLLPYFKDFAGCQITFSAGDMESVSGSDIDIVIKSASLAKASDVAHQIIGCMSHVEDTANIKIDLQESLPQAEIVIDRKRAAELGISVEAIAVEINNSIAGVTATKYRLDGDEYNIVVSYQDSDKKNIIDLENIVVRGKNNSLVSVSNCAYVKKTTGPVAINRLNRTRTIHITASIVTDENAPAVESKIKSLIAKNIIVPSDVFVTFEGAWKNMQTQGKAFSSILILAVLLVFGVMAGTYGSFKAPVINLTTIPFMCIGVIVLYAVRGQPISIMTMLGLVMLVGIVVNNGIILVDYTNLLVERGKELKEACVAAGASRFRPVLMTTCTTILGMLPMSFTTSGSASLVQPIGLCVLGGLTSSTFVTLLFIPVLYSLIMKQPAQKNSPPQKNLPPSAEQNAAAENVNSYNGKKALYRAEIIANQSVQEELCAELEAALEDFQYTLAEQISGRGLSNRKLGNSVWPEKNFVLIAYVTAEEILIMQETVKTVRQRFLSEGIQLFAVKTGMKGSCE